MTRKVTGFSLYNLRCVDLLLVKFRVNYFHWRLSSGYRITSHELNVNRRMSSVEKVPVLILGEITNDVSKLTHCFCGIVFLILKK